MTDVKNLPLIRSRAEISAPAWQVLLFVAAGMVVGQTVAALLALLAPGVPPKPVWALMGILSVTMTAPMLIMAFVLWLREKKS